MKVVDSIVYASGLSQWVPVQAQGWCGSPVQYKGMWDVLAKAVEREGVKGLYKVLPSSRMPHEMCIIIYQGGERASRCNTKAGHRGCDAEASCPQAACTCILAV